MSKLKKLKDYIKINTELFNRIIDNYKLLSGLSFLYNYLEYKSNKGKIKIDLIGTDRIKVVKKEKNKKIIELISFENDEVLSKERIRGIDPKEDINRTYKNNKLILLDAKIILNESAYNETIITIHIEENLVIINDRDVSRLYKNSKLSIDEIYKLLKDNYANAKDIDELKKYPIKKIPKSDREKAMEEDLRQYIKEVYNYHEPLENKDLEDLIIVVNMLMQKEETDKQKIKEYK